MDGSFSTVIMHPPGKGRSAFNCGKIGDLAGAAAYARFRAARMPATVNHGQSRRSTAPASLRHAPN